MSTNWRPFTLPWDDAVVDVSFLFEDERPAGRHGFLGIKDGRLTWADGEPARFWGTCFNSGANFPSHAYSEMVARRLAASGLNLVRAHQMDAEWATPSIFQFNRARSKDDTLTLDPESMDRLDYLLHCLKRHGVYLYLDLLTYRQFRPGDGVDAVDELPQAAKPYHYFDPRLIELQKAFNRDVWTHVNPYTGLAYRDDPSIALCEIVNESDFFAQPPVLEPYRTRLESRYRRWADEQHLRVPAGPVDFRAPDRPMARFFVTVMREYYREMIAHLRGLGVKIPINGTNWSTCLGVLEAQQTADFEDSHTYWNFPTWERPEGTACKPMLGELDTTFNDLSMERTLDRPFVVSEWDHAWPDPYRSESPLWYAAVGALQGWDGLAIHTYRYGTRAPWDRLGAVTINGVTYRNHFDTFNDPAKFGLFPAAAILFRRGDVAAAEHSVAIRVPEDTPDYLCRRAREIPALRLASERHRVGMALPGSPCRADRYPGPDDQVVDAAAGEVLSDTGQVYRSWARRYGWIRTDYTKALYGFLAEAGRVELDGVTLEAGTDWGTIVITSLTREPIRRSDSLLITAVGRCDNTDARYEQVPGAGVRMTGFGHAPVLIEPIEAAVEITTSRPNLKVWVIADSREAVTRLPTEYRDGVLGFRIGAQPPYNPTTIYYLVKV